MTRERSEGAAAGLTEERARSEVRAEHATTEGGGRG
jgi:hypothetical protein